MPMFRFSLLLSTLLSFGCTSSKDSNATTTDESGTTETNTTDTNVTDDTAT